MGENLDALPVISVDIVVCDCVSAANCSEIFCTVKWIISGLLSSKGTGMRKQAAGTS